MILRIVSPEKVIYKGEVQMVKLQVRWGSLPCWKIMRR